MRSDLKQVCYRERLRYGALAKKSLLKLSVRVEVSSVESNKTTAATVSCDLVPPPQRRRRRHPPLPPPRNLPFVTFQGSKETYLSLHKPVVAIEVVGAAANALILYAMIASKQYKKQLLIRSLQLSAACCSLYTEAVKHLSQLKARLLALYVATYNILSGVQSKVP